MASGTTELALLLYANIKNFMTNIARAEREMKKVGDNMMKTGKTLSVGLTAPLVGLGTAAVASSMRMESLRKGLTAVAGTSEEAEAQFERLKEVAKLPGLGLEEAVQGSVNLQAAGFSAEQAEKSLKAFGNALATVGRGKADLDGVILALGQIQSKGKISAEEINQLAERVPQIRQIMVSAFGTAVPEAIQKMGVSSEEFVSKVTDELLKLPQVTGGLGNAFENLGDATKVSLGKIGDTIAEAFDLENVFNSVAESLQGVASWFENLSPSGQKAVVGIGAVAAAIGPLSIGIGFFTKSILPNMIAGLNTMKLAFTAMTGPIGIIVTAVAAIGTAIFAFTRSTDEASASQQNFAEISRQVESSVAGEKVKLDALLKVAKDEKKSRAERQKALSDAIAIAPDYLSGITLETVNTSDAQKAIDSYIVSFKRKIALQASEKKYADIQDEITKNEQKRKEIQDQAAKSFMSVAAAKELKALEGEYKNLNTQAEEVNTNIEKIVAETITAAQELKDKPETENFTNVSDVIKDLRADIKALEGEYKVFGDQVDVNSEKQKLYTDAIKDLIADGVSPASTQIAQLKSELQALQDQVEDSKRSRITSSGISPIQSLGTTGFAAEQPTGLMSSATAIEQMSTKLQESSDKQKANIEALQSTYQNLGSTIGNVFAQAINDTDNFAEAGKQIIFKSIAEIIKALLAQAIAGWVANNIATLGPLGLAAAAAGPAIVGGLFDALIPKLAQGGITTGPTLAMVGDNPSGREMILPLEKAKDFFGNQTPGNIRLHAVLKGQDLLLSTDRAARADRRNGGRR